MTDPAVRPGDPELSMIETLEIAMEVPGHTFNDLDPDIEAAIEQHLLGAVEGKTFDGGFCIRIKPMGRAAVRRFRERQADPVARKRALPDLYLRYVWERNDAGSDAYPDRFLATKPHWCGRLYTAAEVERTGAWLFDRGFINGIRGSNSDAPVRVTITAAGENVIESGSSVYDAAVAAAGSTYFYNTISASNVNMAQQSQHVTQNQDNRSGVAAALELVDAVLTHAAQLPTSERVVVDAAAENLRTEAEGSARSASLRELSRTAVTAAVTAGSTAGINEIAEHLVPHLMKVLATLAGS